MALVLLLGFAWPAWECAADAASCLAPGFLTAGGIGSWLGAASTVGILATSVCLLMIAGEVDLSVGAIAALSGTATVLGITQLALSPVAAAAFAVGLALLVGLLNGWLVTRTGLPSLTVTLATLLLVGGLTLAAGRLWPGVIPPRDLAALSDDPFVRLFAGDVAVGDLRIPASVVWWALMTGAAAWILSRTASGNWILGTGGNPQAARDAGVPVRGVKVSLFVATAASGALVALMEVFREGVLPAAAGSALLGVEPIAASAIGGTLLTGGLGSPIGAALGALSLGMARIGIPLAGLPAESYIAVLGISLVVGAFAVMLVRSRLTPPR